MKNANYFFFFISLFLLFLFSFCEDVDTYTQTEVFGELKKKREDNNKKFREKINEYLKELKLDNAKTINREQFKNIFFKLFEFGAKELKNEEENNEKIDLNKDYIDKIFNNLINKDVKEIEINKIIEYFEPSNILFALKDTLKIIGIDNTMDNLSESIIHTLNAFDEKNKKKNNEKNTDL